MAGLVQCYRGLELVAGAEKLVFSAVDIDFTVSYSCIHPLVRAHPSADARMRVLFVLHERVVIERSSESENIRRSEREAAVEQR